jgi:hypothetical protein
MTAKAPDLFVLVVAIFLNIIALYRAFDAISITQLWRIRKRWFIIKKYPLFMNPVHPADLLDNRRHDPLGVLRLVELKEPPPPVAQVTLLDHRAPELLRVIP